MSGDLLIQQDLQEVPDLDPDEETALSAAEEELLEMHNLSLRRKARLMFPPDCLQVVRLMRGNNACVDCQGFDTVDGIMVEPMYASVTHGTLLCRKCSDEHRLRDERAFGIKSFMDDVWYFQDVLALTEGGNHKFREYCAVTNAYPTLETDVEDKKQFIDGIYSSVAVKAYRSLLRKAVATTLEKQYFIINRQLERRAPPTPNPNWDVEEEVLRIPHCKFCKELPMLSICDYYTKSLGKEWPGAVTSAYDEIIQANQKVNEPPVQFKPGGSSTDSQTSYTVPLKSDDEKLEVEDVTSTIKGIPNQASLIRPIRRYLVHDDDNYSVMSASVGSSVGSLDLLSIPDGRSVASSDVESLTDLKKEQMSNLHGGIQKHESFRDLDENVQDATYAPEDFGNSASHLHELEASGLHGCDSSNPTRNVDSVDSHGEAAPTPKNTLELSFQKLDTLIGEKLISRQKGKTIGFSGLPSNPPERFTKKPIMSRAQSAPTVLHPVEPLTRNPISQERREKQRLNINARAKAPVRTSDMKYMPSEPNLSQRVTSVYTQQMKSIASKFDRSKSINGDSMSQNGRNTWTGGALLSQHAHDANGRSLRDLTHLVKPTFTELQSRQPTPSRGLSERISQSLREISSRTDDATNGDLKSRLSKSLRNFPSFEATS